MQSRLLLSRRTLIASASAGVGGLLLAGCDRLSRAPSYQQLLASAEGLNYRSQRLLEFDQPLAREFPASAISRVFKQNGTLNPGTPPYKVLEQEAFLDWRLTVDGLVTRPLQLSLAQLKGLPARTQITRHDCVEGWSAIGQWTGVQLGLILSMAGLAPSARFIVFHCADFLGGPGSPYYESIDLVDAFHPQTILAYDLNGAPLPVGNGAPLRLRVERQLGYKMAKYVMRVEAVERLDNIQGGKGGFWEDRGYEWYAGI